MPKLTILVLILIHTSCGRNILSAMQLSETYQIENSNSDSLFYGKQLLVENGVIESDFDTNKITSFAEYLIGEQSLGLVQIEYNESSKNWSVEPNYNILFLRDKNNKFCYSVFPSSYADDFTLYYRGDDYFIFKSYSSSVGYSEFIIFHVASSRFFLTQKYDESEKLDIRKIDLNTLENISFIGS